MQREMQQNRRPGPRQHIGGELEKLIAGRRGGLWTKARDALLRGNRWFFKTRRSRVRLPRWSGSFVPVWARPWATQPDIVALFKKIGVSR